MTRLRVAGVLVAGAALVTAAIAVAGSSTSISDPKHDLLSTMLPSGVKKDDVDITKASVGRANGKITMKLTVVGSVGKAIGNKKTPPEFFVKVGSDYFGIFPVDRVVDDFTSGHRSGSVSMTKPNSHTVAATFKPKAIGSPSKYQWYADVGACTIFDRAPDTGFTHSKRRC